MVLLSSAGPGIHPVIPLQEMRERVSQNNPSNIQGGCQGELRLKRVNHVWRLVTDFVYLCFFPSNSSPKAYVSQGAGLELVSNSTSDSKTVSPSYFVLSHISA